jgi:hypothetical protein
MHNISNHWLTVDGWLFFIILNIKEAMQKS